MNTVITLKGKFDLSESGNRCSGLLPPLYPIVLAFIQFHCSLLIPQNGLRKKELTRKKKEYLKVCFGIGNTSDFERKIKSWTEDKLKLLPKIRL